MRVAQHEILSRRHPHSQVSAPTNVLFSGGLPPPPLPLLLLLRDDQGVVFNLYSHFRSFLIPLLQPPKKVDLHISAATESKVIIFFPIVFPS